MRIPFNKIFITTDGILLHGISLLVEFTVYNLIRIKTPEVSVFFPSPYKRMAMDTSL